MRDCSKIKAGREWTNEELKNLDTQLKHVGLELFDHFDFSNVHLIAPGNHLSNINLDPVLETEKEARAFCKLYQFVEWEREFLRCSQRFRQ